LVRLGELVDADVAIAGPLHAEDFRVIPPDGFLLSRDAYLGAVEAGNIDYLVFEPISEIDVRVYGEGAVLTYQSRVDVDVARRGRFTLGAWHTYLYERRAGRWQVVWEQATAVGGFPPTPNAG
jgi:hypothetical protein